MVTGARWAGPLSCVLAIGLAGCSPSPPPVSSATTAQSAMRLPPSGAKFSYQLGGAYAPPEGTGIVGRDRRAEPAEGLYSICYVNAFQSQSEELEWWQREHPDLLLRDEGKLVMDQDWDEALLDTRRAEQLMAVVGPWIDGCARAGFQAIEADNLDSFTRSDGLLTAVDSLRFGALLAERAHADGMAIGQKNAAELVTEARRAGFDFAIAEECQVYDECDVYTDGYGGALIEIEYTDQPTAAFTTACEVRGATVSVVRRDRDLAPAGSPGHVEQWC
jgi:hypothetical protein